MAIGGFGLRMKIEDMLKFGILYLQNGKWNARQLIPSAWIEISTHPSSVAESVYGYHWWTMNKKESGRQEHKTYYAMGMGGMRSQYIFVHPEHKLVAVFTSIVSDDSIGDPVQYFNDYL